jgi:hypothetical protein
MGDSLTKNQGLDRTESLNGESKLQSHLGDDMTHKSFNEIFSKPKVENSSHLPPADMLMSRLSDTSTLAPSEQVCEVTALPRCEAPTHEKRGTTEVVSDEHGEIFEVKDNRGHTYSKTSDGKWVGHEDSDADFKLGTVFKNLNVDDKGNITYDDNNNINHYERNSDGSGSMTNEFGKTSWDKDDHCIEAPAGPGHSRKYHYTDGQLDQIDGKLGHWDRVTKDGQVSWVNKDTFAVWDGDFKLELDGELEYKGRNGANWSFTVWGKDIDNTQSQKK